MKRLSILILLFSVAVLVSSCFNFNEEVIDESAFLYGTEWSTEDMSEGLKFYKGNEVLFFCETKYGVFNGAGKFDYSASYKILTFEGLTINYGSYIVDINAAQIQNDGTMKLIWHKVGKEENYYEILYQRR